LGWIGLIILVGVLAVGFFAFSLLASNELPEAKTETTTKWVGAPIAKETSVTKNKTSFSAMPTDEERGAK